MNAVEKAVCRTKLQIVDDLLGEVLATLAQSGITREQNAELSRDVIQCTSHIRKVIDNLPSSVT